jgi:hypothetical protein
MVRVFFRPVPYLAFPLYRNSATGNGTETRDTIYTEDNKLSTQKYNTISIPTAQIIRKWVILFSKAWRRVIYQQANYFAINNAPLIFCWSVWQINDIIPFHPHFAKYYSPTKVKFAYWYLSRKTIDLFQYKTYLKYYDYNLVHVCGFWECLTKQLINFY